MYHNFNIKLAERYGIEGALLLDCIYWWIHKNECNEEMIKEGRVWCYMSAKGFNKYFPYMSSQKIRRELLKLEEKGVIVIGNFNESAINQTLWYAFSDNGMKELDALGFDFSKMKNGVFKNEKSEFNNKEINKEDNNKNNSKELSKKADEDKAKQADLREKEANYNKYMANNYPLVQKMREPLTYEQFLKLCEHYERDAIYNVLTDMNNWAELRKKRVSAYQTALKWLLNAESKIS